jgi:murein DD-endopeptidase MepM/ murein hydrolase activator NlpD
LRGLAALIAVVGVAACTDYQPVRMTGSETWLQARSQAAADAARVRAGTSLVQIDDAGNTRHVVMPGESVYLLAKKYDVRPSAIVDANRLKRPYRIYAGQVIAIPASAEIPTPRSTQIARAEGRVPSPLPAPRSPAKTAPAVDHEGHDLTVASLAPVSPPTARPADSVSAITAPSPAPPSPMPAWVPAPVSAVEQRDASEAKPPRLSGDGFLWPIKGQVISKFGEKPNGQRNDGINIAAPMGTAVLAAENGIVVYAGNQIAGFGNMLILRHAGGFITTYAHNERLSVTVGDRVRRGQVIAEVGATGAVGTAQLHFELREGTKPIDPISHLVSPQRVVASSGGD